MKGRNILAIFLVILGIIFLTNGVFATGITINNGEEYANNVQVSINIKIAQDNNYCILESNVDTDCNTTNWLKAPSNDFNTNFNLSSTQGEKTVYLHDCSGFTCTLYPDSIKLDTASPSLTITGISENEYVGSNHFDIDIGIDTSDGPAPRDKAFYQINSQAPVYLLSAGQTITLDFNEGTNSLRVDSNDLAGNESTQTITFYVDTTTPSLTSISNSYSGSGVYTNSETPTFTFALTETNPDKIYISCNNDTDWNEVTYASSISSFNITTGDDCNTEDGTKTIYAKVIDKVSKESSVVSTTVNYDNTNPGVPTGLSVSNGNGEVTISWTAPSADNLSGNKEYKVYNNGEYVSPAVTTTSKTITGLTNGTAYSFKVKTIDNAGNESDFSSIITGTPQQDSMSSDVTVKKNGSSIEYVKPSDIINIACSLEHDSQNVRIKYRYDSGSIENLTSEEDNTDYVTSSFTISNSNYDQVRFWCAWQYSSVSYESSAKVIIIDNTLPTVTWNDTNNTFSRKRTISFDATDDKLINTVDLYIGTDKLVLTKTTNTYSYDFNSEKYANGTYTLKASVTDVAGNKTEKTRTITIQNTLTKDQEKETAIKDALSKKKVVEDLIKYLEGQGVLISQEILTKKTIADGLIEDANALTEINAIKLKANEAIAIYNEINSELPSNVEVISTRDYEYSIDDVVAILIALGIDQESAEQARNTMEQTNVTRSIEILKVGDGYQAKIKITLVNDTNDTVFKIIEIVPKGFAGSAALLHASHPFIVIEDDPIIEFTIDTPIGSTVEVSYGIANLSEESANALIDNNIIASFAAPPIVTGNDTTISGNLGANNNGFGLLLTIIVIVIIVLVLAGAGAFVYMQYSKNSTPSFGTTSKNGLSNKIKAKVKKDNKNPPNKWKYKG